MQNGAGELVGKSTLNNLERCHITYSWSPPDTRELNSMSKRKNRTHNEITLCMLTRASCISYFGMMHTRWHNICVIGYEFVYT